jgi:hypothetical protein
MCIIHSKSFTVLQVHIAHECDLYVGSCYLAILFDTLSLWVS